MDYFWIVAVSLAVGLYGNHLAARSANRRGSDVAFAIAGGLFTAFLFRMTNISAEVGLAGVLVFSAIGAGVFLILRRSLSPS